MKHLDLFAPAAPAPQSGLFFSPDPDPAAWPPARPRPWLDLLARAPLVPVELVVSALWTGEVLEQLSYPGQPTRHLHRDGSISELDAGLQRAARIVHLTRQDAALHLRRPLALLAYDGPSCARLRIANAGQPRSDHILLVLDGLRGPS